MTAWGPLKSLADHVGVFREAPDRFRRAFGVSSFRIFVKLRNLAKYETFRIVYETPFYETLFRSVCTLGRSSELIAICRLVELMTVVEPRETQSMAVTELDIDISISCEIAYQV